MYQYPSRRNAPLTNGKISITKELNLTTKIRSFGDQHKCIDEQEAKKKVRGNHIISSVNKA